MGDMAPGPRPKMSEWARQLNGGFAGAGLRARVLCWFRQTGNFAVDAAGDGLTEIRKQLASVTGTAWVLFCLPQLDHQITGASSASIPPVEPRTRWTRGLALRVDRVDLIPATTETWTTRHGVFEPVDNRIARVWKRDPLADRNKLERRRRPPWGTISRDCSHRFGGTWTSRSLSTLEGLLTRVRKMLKRGPPVEQARIKRASSSRRQRTGRSRAGG